MVVCEFALVGSAERGFQSETVCDAQLFPDNDTSCRLLGLLNSKVAVREVENVAVLIYQTGEYLLFEAVIKLSRVAIHEDVLLAGMSMDIAEQEDVPVLLKLLDHLQEFKKILRAYHLSVINGGMNLSLGVVPDSVEIHSCQVAASAPINDAIWVEHRDNLEHEVVSEDLGIKGGTREIVDDSLHYPGGSALSGVHARCYYDTLSVFDGLGIALEGRDNDHLAIVARNGGSKRASAEAILALGITFKGVQISTHVSVGVRVAMREIHCVFIVLELHTKGQRVVIASILPLHRVLIVANVSTTSVPSLSTSARLDLRIDYRPHPMIV